MLSQRKHNLSEKQMAWLLALLVAVMPFSVDAYLPAVPQMAQALSADIHRIEQSLGSFILGVAFGQLLGGSLSDVKGRRNTALLGLGVYVFGSVWLIFADSADALLGWRLVQAVGAGMSGAVVGAIVRDNYEGRQAAEMFALIGIIMMAAPLLAPLLGERLQAWAGWRSVFVFLSLYGFAVFAALLLWLPQHKKAEPLTWRVLPDAVARYRRVFSTKPALGIMFFQAASFSSMLAFLTESPFVYMQLYQLPPQHYVWVFGCNIVVMAVFNRVTAWRLKRGSNPQNILLAGVLVQLCANIFLAAQVLLLQQPPLRLLVPGVMVSVGTQGLISANTQMLFMSHFKEEGGSANAVLGSCQSLLAAGAGFLTAALHNGTAAVMTGMMLAATLSGIAMLWLFSRSVWQKQR